MNFYTSALAKINTKTNSGSVVALGCFDGVHIGHSKIISNAVNLAKERSLISVVWSFQAPPKSVLSKRDDPSFILTPPSEKKALISALGVDTLICAPFNEKIAKLSPRDFFEDIIIDRLNAKHLFCGFNYRFGYMGSGDAALLQALCDEYGVSLTVINEVTVDGTTVSSSAIRTFLANGELEKAQKMLGRPFTLRGKIKDGQHLGRTLGFPTVNQDLPKNKILIKNGVYLTRIKLGKTSKYGVTNIGMRPTVEGKAPICETHILDFNGNLYGKTLTVEFLKFLRSEKKFSSLTELTAQIKTDVENAKKYISI